MFRRFGALALVALATLCFSQSSGKRSDIIASSGAHVTINNKAGAPLTASFEEKISGSPSTVSVVIQGCETGGTCDTLDTYTTVADAIRSVQIIPIYDSFVITASWTGGTGVSVSVNTSTSHLAETVTGITKSMVGLGNVDNTSDAGKPVSTAQQTALNLKLPTSYLDTDGTLASDSDVKVASQKAVKTYVDANGGGSGLPTQTAHNNELLTTNGTTAAWSGASLTFDPTTSEMLLGIPTNDPSFTAGGWLPGVLTISRSTEVSNNPNLEGIVIQVQGLYPSGMFVDSVATGVGGENDGITVEAGSVNGTIGSPNTVFGVSVSPWELTGGVASNVAGFLMVPQNAGGTITNYAGLYVEPGLVGIGSHNYGVWIDDQGNDSATYAIYVPGTGTGNKVLFGNLKSTTGTRFVCADTSGNLVSSASACSGT